MALIARCEKCLERVGIFAQKTSDGHVFCKKCAGYILRPAEKLSNITLAEFNDRYTAYNARLVERDKEKKEYEYFTSKLLNERLADNYKFSQETIDWFNAHNTGWYTWDNQPQSFQAYLKDAWVLGIVGNGISIRYYPEVGSDRKSFVEPIELIIPHTSVKTIDYYSRTKEEREYTTRSANKVERLGKAALGEAVFGMAGALIGSEQTEEKVLRGIFHYILSYIEIIFTAKSGEDKKFIFFTEDRADRFSDDDKWACMFVNLYHQNYGGKPKNKHDHSESLKPKTIVL